MEKNKEAVFVGGVHGSGKTTVCKRLCEILKGTYAKQRHLLIAYGKRQGYVTWEEIGSRHNYLISAAVNEFIQLFLTQNSHYLFVDSHFAIRSEKALRLKGKSTGEPYIADLDYRFIDKVSQVCAVKFVLLVTEPHVALSRLSERLLEPSGYGNTLLGLTTQAEQELIFFRKIVEQFSVRAEDCLMLENNGELESVIKKLILFLQQ